MADLSDQIVIERIKAIDHFENFAVLANIEPCEENGAKAYHSGQSARAGEIALSQEKTQQGVEEPIKAD